MKKTTLVRIGFLALVLCLVTAALLSVTLARYNSTVTGGGSAAVAKWDFKANTQASAFDFTMEGTGASKKIVPGDHGDIVLNLANNGDVSADYEIKFTTLPSADSNFTFKLTNSDGAVLTTSNSVKGVIASGGTEAVTIYWAYADITGGSTAAASASQTVALKVDGTQSTTATAAAVPAAVISPV